MPDTNAYLYLGLAVITTISVVYLASVVLRFRGAVRQIHFLTSLDDDH